MSNCVKCGKRFTCGCQKTYDENGAAICKTCVAPKQEETSRSLNMNLAQQKINSLKK
jgi:ribosomal protein L28